MSSLSILTCKNCEQIICENNACLRCVKHGVLRCAMCPTPYTMDEIRTAVRKAEDGKLTEESLRKHPEIVVRPPNALHLTKFITAIIMQRDASMLSAAIECGANINNVDCRLITLAANGDLRLLKIILAAMTTTKRITQLPTAVRSLIRNGDEMFLRAFVSEYKPTMTPSCDDVDDGESFLVFALRANQENLFATLLELGVPINYRDTKHRQTVLHAACHDHNLSAVVALLSFGADATLYDRGGNTALHVAKDVDVVRALLDVGVDVDARDVNGCTALYYAAKEDRIGVMELLMKRGAEANAQMTNGTAAIHVACFHGNLRAVCCLAKAGAQLDLLTREGVLPARISELRGFYKITAMFKNRSQAEREVLETLSEY